MTSKYQNAAIRAALTNADTFTKDKDFQIAVGKDIRLIQPCTYACYHVDFSLINAYAKSG